VLAEKIFPMIKALENDPRIVERASELDENLPFKETVIGMDSAPESVRWSACCFLLRSMHAALLIANHEAWCDSGAALLFMVRRWQEQGGSSVSEYGPN
jgi:hypothetical protein